jgi:hypothetical protein
VEHRATVWFVIDQRQVQEGVGLPLPTGWAWLCECKSLACGFETRYLAETAQLVHKQFDSYVYTWLGDAPDQLVRESLRRFGPGRAGYIWGGMRWDVTVVTSDGYVDRDPVTGRPQYVRLAYGDVVTLVGERPDATLQVWRAETGDTIT